MHIVTSRDLYALEQALADRLAGRPAGGLEDPVLLLAPSRRLLEHLKAALARRLHAVLGVHGYTYQGLARRALEHVFVVPPRALPDAALELALEASLREIDSPAAERLGAYPGTLRSLLETCRDLRDAGISPRELAAAGLEPSLAHPLLGELYRRFTGSLERLGQAGWADEAETVRTALPHVEPFLRAKGIRRVLHYGAYELTGRNLELARELDRAASVELFLPVGRGRAYRYAREAASFYGGLSAPGPLESAETAAAERSWTARLESLYEPGARLPPRGEDKGPAVEICHSQGAEAELRAAALRALSLLLEESRCDPPLRLDDIAIVARSLEPYLPFLDGTLESLGIPFTTSAKAPLSHEAAVRALLSFLRTLAGGLERSAVLDLLRNPLLRLGTPALGAAEIDTIDRLSRRYRIDAGYAAWSTLREQAGSGHEGLAGALLAALETLEEDRRRWSAAGTLAQHAAVLDAFAKERLECASCGALEDLLASVADLADASETLQAAEPLDPAAALAVVERLAARERLPVGDSAGRGVRVLDLMQARGLTHRAVIWIGFHDGLFPRRARPDPFLSDAARRALRESTGKPLSVKSAAADEERLLLAVTLSAVRDRLVVSFQRADEKGSRRGRSSALREIARWVAGRPDVEALLSAGAGGACRVERIPAHPGERAMALARSPLFGLLPPREAVAGAALTSGEPADAARSALDAVGGLDPLHRTCLEWIDALETFEPGGGAADGVTGIPLELERPLFPTHIERLTRCPLSFFLRDVLQARPLDDEVRLDGIEEHVLGRAVHDAVESLYAALDREGRIRAPLPEPPGAVLARARTLLPAVWEEALRRAVGPSWEGRREFLLLAGERFLAALTRFIERDLQELLGSEPESILLEQDLAAGVSFAPDLEVRLAGRIDRLWKSGAEWVVDDYKSSGDIAAKLAAGAILKGHELQLPLYRELVSRERGASVAEVRARLLGIGPENEGSRELDRAASALRDGFLETVAVALRLARQGRFPFREVERRCGYCAYRRTCRRTHEPSVARRENDPFLRELRDLDRKSSRAPLLAELGAADGSENDGGQE